jgi:ArsR family transcriptional regulator
MSNPSAIPDAFLHQMAAKFRLLGDPMRLAILRSLMEGEKSVGRVVEETRGGQANVSKHLKLLHDAGLIARRKAGLQVFYCVCDPLVERLCTLVCTTLIEQTRDDVERGRQILKRAGQDQRHRPV